MCRQSRQLQTQPMLVIMKSTILIRSLALLEYLYSLWRTHVFTCHAENAVLFPYHKGLLVRSWVAGSFEPFIDVNWAGLDARAVCHADVKVDANIVAPNSKLAWSVVR